MAQPKSKDERDLTRKEHKLRRKDEELNRRVMIGLLAAAALVVLLIAAGIIAELVIKPMQPIATVNDTKIGLRDFQKRVKLDWFQAGSVTDPLGTSQKTLDTLVDEQLLREQAQQRGITVTEDEITEAIEKSFGYYRVPPTPAPTATPDPQATPSTEPTATPQPTATPVTLESYQTQYKDYLSRMTVNSGMKETDFRKLVELDLIRQKLYDDVTKDEPTTAEQVRLRHILVAIRTPAATSTGQPTPDASAPTATPTLEPRDEAQALARIIEVKQKLDAGEDFAKLAEEYSDDTGSKTQGGELGWYAKGQGFVQEFEDAAFKLQAGETSDPIKTQYGYHLIQVEERDPARTLDDYTIQVNKYQAYNTWLTDLRAAAKIDRKWAADKVPPTPSAQ